MTRAERVDRYREKKARRTDGGAVRYIARQQNAHRCGRSRSPVGTSQHLLCTACCTLPLVLSHFNQHHVPNAALAVSFAGGLASRAVS